LNLTTGNRFFDNSEGSAASLGLFVVVNISRANVNIHGDFQVLSNFSLEGAELNVQGYLTVAGHSVLALSNASAIVEGTTHHGWLCFPT